MRLQSNGFSAWITMGDVEQSNYNIEHSPDGSFVTCWIVSEVGKSFSVHWQDVQRTFPSLGKVLVDGMSGPGKVLNCPALRDTAFQDGFRTSRETKRLFMFSELELTDDDQFLHTVAPDLGTIKLDIWRCEVVDSSESLLHGVYTYSDPEKIHERSKKGFGHCCKLGPDVPHVKRRGVSTRNLCKIVTFEFKYRPLAHLHANGIISFNQNLKHARKLDEVLDLSKDNEDDEAPVAQRIRALRAELHQLEERERKRHKHIKVKPEAHSAKVKAEEHDNFIDLT